MKLSWEYKTSGKNRALLTPSEAIIMNNDYRKGFGDAMKIMYNYILKTMTAEKGDILFSRFSKKDLKKLLKT